MNVQEISQDVFVGFFHCLPPEVALRIFKYFGYKELALLSRVCKSFYQMCQHPELWESMYRKHYEASYNLIRYLGQRHGNSIRHWKMDFQRKFTERRCESCGLVYNLFNDGSHSHKSMKRKGEEGEDVYVHY